MKVRDLIFKQLELGKKYEITHYDEDNGFTRYRGTVEKFNDTSVFIRVFETDGEKDEGTTWIDWRDIDAFEEL
ncbi:hypothetical protein AT268_31690 [Bacillus cereus]|uniref:Uncharacterized protein n=1 Tax=Bacillus cereus TaxID=1396 RepID=A0A9X0MJU2_BACCE|nr:hypothetical protein [Bacillus cereus]KXY51068.1 hypothetical protein AT268_31690 [Bacillus cereus]PEZ75226.1 hypothetical protein CN410_14195 [Bacillus anthracis]